MEASLRLYHRGKESCVPGGISWYLWPGEDKGELRGFCCGTYSYRSRLGSVNRLQGFANDIPCRSNGEITPRGDGLRSDTVAPIDRVR